MENKNNYFQGFLRIAHFPSLVLIAGYLFYWLELYFIRRQDGLTSWSAYILVILFGIIIIFLKRKDINGFLSWVRVEFKKQSRFTKLYLIISLGIALFVSLVVTYAYLLPPHLIQESDTLNYHLALPRQHLILGSFRHIEWSSGDLFLLPIDFALSPFWFATALPNKFIHLLFWAGLIMVTVSLTRRLSKNSFISVCIVVFSIFGSHFLGIQMGTAMLDIAICYLFLAALDSFLNKDMFLSSIEFAFFFWAKPFIPLQFAFITAVMLVLMAILKRLGFKSVNLAFSGAGHAYKDIFEAIKIRKLAFSFIFLSILIAGPFIAKSIYYAGTPLYPFAAGSLKVNRNIDFGSEHFKSIADTGQKHASAKDWYGHGRSPLSFLKHFWLISVPESGVNNSYDYPVGLMYLLFLGPFVLLFFGSLRQKQVPILPLFVVVYWLSWWLGSQQSRFLYIPVLFLMISVASEMKVLPRVFAVAAAIALILTSLSVFRAHRPDLDATSYSVLRAKDKEILDLNQKYVDLGRKGVVILGYCDVAFAQFPVEARGGVSPWYLKSKNR